MGSKSYIALSGVEKARYSNAVFLLMNIWIQLDFTARIQVVYRFLIVQVHELRHYHKYVVANYWAAPYDRRATGVETSNTSSKWSSLKGCILGSAKKARYSRPIDFSRIFTGGHCRCARHFGIISHTYSKTMGLTSIIHQFEANVPYRCTCIILVNSRVFAIFFTWLHRLYEFILMMRRCTASITFYSA